MAKKTEKLAETEAAETTKPVIIGDDGGPEYILPPEKLQRTRELLCKAYESLCITNGNELLFFGKDVEKIVIHLRGD